ncbi:MAG: 50S ribosomal protein L29 [Gammaproteobacteria bacterium]
MIASELRTKSVEELSSLLLELRRKQFNMRMQSGLGQQPARSSEVRETRRDIARIKTILEERRRSDAA